MRDARYGMREGAEPGFSSRWTRSPALLAAPGPRIHLVSRISHPASRRNEQAHHHEVAGAAAEDEDVPEVMVVEAARPETRAAEDQADGAGGVEETAQGKPQGPGG